MNIARNLLSLRTAVARSNQSLLTSKLLRRESHVVSYRKGPPAHSNATKIGAIAVGGAMWWWVIWHLWHEPDHITGEFEYQNPSKWSNTELGIPKDD